MNSTEKLRGRLKRECVEVDKLKEPKSMTQLADTLEKLNTEELKLMIIELRGEIKFLEHVIKDYQDEMLEMANETMDDWRSSVQ